MRDQCGAPIMKTKESMKLKERAENVKPEPMDYHQILRR